MAEPADSAWLRGCATPGRRRERLRAPLTSARHRRVRAVRDAAGGLRVVFQPIRDLASGTVVGYEALSRFPTGSPMGWFNEAHQLGLGIELEIAAVSDAVAQRRPGWGYVSVNVSPAVVVAPPFLDLVARLPDPSRLVLELTEHSVVDDYGRLCGVLEEMRSGGVRIAIDDTGGGVSSLRHVLLISPDIIKLDRSLIERLDEDDRRQALAELMVQFSNRIEARLVAEGIERDEELAACLRHGIELGQGYLLGRPGSAPDPASGSVP